MVCDLLLPRDGLSSSTQLRCYKWQLDWRELEQAMNWAKAGSPTADIFTAGYEVPKMKNDLEPLSAASFERQAGLCKKGLVQWRCWWPDQAGATWFRDQRRDCSWANTLPWKMCWWACQKTCCFIRQLWRWLLISVFTTFLLPGWKRLELRGKHQHLTTEARGILRWNLSSVTLHLQLRHTVDVNLCADHRLWVGCRKAFLEFHSYLRKPNRWDWFPTSCCSSPLVGCSNYSA